MRSGRKSAGALSDTALRYRHFWHNHFAAQLADLSTRLRTRFQLRGEFASLETDGDDLSCGVNV